MSNIEQMDKKELFNEYQDELDFLKQWIENKSLSHQEIQEIESNFYDWLHKLKDSIPESSKDKFKDILYKLETSSETLDFTDIETIWKIFIELEDAQLEQAELLALRESIKTIRSEKNSLNQLRQTVWVNRNLSSKEQELKEKYEKISWKVEKLWQSYPTWTKAILSTLPTTMLPLFKKEEQENSNDWFWEIKDIFSTLKNNILVPIYSFLLNLGWGVPDEVKEVYKELQSSNLSSEDVKSLTTMWVWFTSTMKGLEQSEVAMESKEKAKEVVLPQIKTYLSEKMWIEDEEKLDKAITRWYDTIKDDGIKVKENLENMDFEKMDITEMIDVIWLGSKASLEMLIILADEGLIDYKQIWFEVVKAWWKMILNTALFFPNLVKVTFWEMSMEELYNFVENSELAKENKEMLLVMVYRALNSWPWKLLQNIAALPFHGVSAIASTSDWVSSIKSMKEAFTNSWVDEQLKTLSKIEETLSWREWKVYQGIQEAFDKYRQWIIWSYAFQRAENLEDFKKLIKEAWINLNNAEVKNLIKNLEIDWFDKANTKHIANFVDSIKWQIANIDNTWWREIIESMKWKVWWVFSKNNFFDEATSKLSKSLEKNAEIFYRWYLSKFYQKWKGRFNFAAETWWIKQLDSLAHFTWDVNDLKWFANELREIAKASPDVAKYFFRNLPAIWLWADLINSWWIEDVTKAFAYLVPIVWPITFFNSKEKDLTTYAWTAIWLWLDWLYMYQAKSLNIAKLAYQPIADTIRWWYTWAKISWRYSKNISKKALDILKKPKWAIWLWAGILALSYGMVSADGIEDTNDAIRTLQFISEKEWWSSIINETVIENINTYNEETQEAIYAATISKYLWFTPDMLESWNYIEDINIKEDKKEVIIKINETIELDEKEVNLEDFKHKLDEIVPSIEQLIKKWKWFGFKLILVR